MRVWLRPVETADQRRIYEQYFLQFFHALAQYDSQLVITQHGYPCWKPTLDAGVAIPVDVPSFYEFNKWVRDACDTFLIYADATPAGFVTLCNLPGVLPEDCDNELMDFFVVPKFRRMGVGAQAAQQAFDLRPGRWAVYELDDNVPAKLFWARVIGAYTGGRFENLNGGALQRFSNAR